MINAKTDWYYCIDLTPFGKILLYNIYTIFRMYFYISVRFYIKITLSEAKKCLASGGFSPRHPPATRGSAPGSHCGVSQQSKPQTLWRIRAIVPLRTVWAIFFPTKNYVSEHHKSIYEGQKPFRLWGLRPGPATKDFVHGLAFICNACAGVVSRSNCTRNVSFGEPLFW